MRIVSLFNTHTRVFGVSLCPCLVVANDCIDESDEAGRAESVFFFGALCNHFWLPREALLSLP